MRATEIHSDTIPFVICYAFWGPRAFTLIAFEMPSRLERERLIGGY